MYQYIKGLLTEKGLDYIVVETAGIGYYLNVSTTTLEQTKQGDEVKIFTKLIVREDAHILCGFSDVREREFFEHLISVSGIGQRVAMNILSAADYMSILSWIMSADEKKLTKLPGLGKKTAQRLIVELRDKFKKTYGNVNVASATNADIGADAQNSEDIVLALTGLGFKRDEISRMLTGVDMTTLSIEDAIKLALTQNR